jgi:hypothetical protein
VNPLKHNPATCPGCLAERRVAEFLKAHVLAGGLASANKANERGVQLTMPVPSAANGGLGPISGDPLMFGHVGCPLTGLAAVAESSYTPPTGVATGSIACSFEGVYFLTVKASSTICPSTGVAINPGDKVYFDGWSYDSTTGCLYGGILDANSTSGLYYGNSLDALASGVTATVRVRLKVAG